MNLRKIRISTLLILITLLAHVPTTSAETDTFKQILNYLAVGDTHSESGHMITDRKNCITENKILGELLGVELNIRIFWNNVIPENIQIFHKLNHMTGQWGYEIALSGEKAVAEVVVANWEVELYLLEAGITKGFHRNWEIGPNATDLDRTRKALQLLYSDHCTGSKSKAAF